MPFPTHSDESRPPRPIRTLTLEEAKLARLLIEERANRRAVEEVLDDVTAALQLERRTHETTRAHAQTAVDELNAAMRQLLLARDAILRATTHLAK